MIIFAFLIGIGMVLGFELANDTNNVTNSPTMQIENQGEINVNSQIGGKESSGGGGLLGGLF